MLNRFFKRILVGLVFFSYAATSIAMEDPNKNDEKDKPIYSQKYDIKKLLKVAAWYGADVANFALGNGRFIFAGVDGLHYLYVRKNNDGVPLSQLEQLKLPKELEAIVKSVCTTMQVLPETKIEISASPVGSFAAAGHKKIILDPYLSNLVDADEQSGILAHECSHVLRNDSVTRVLTNLAVPVLSYGILKGYEYAANRLLSFIQKKYSKQKDDTVDRSTKALKEINFIIANHFIFRYLLNLYLLNATIRYKEFRADYDGAMGLQNPQGLISYFKKQQSPDFIKKLVAILPLSLNAAYSNMRILDRAYFFLSSFDGRLGMPEHPSWQERIKALELLNTLRK